MSHHKITVTNLNWYWLRPALGGRPHRVPVDFPVDAPWMVHQVGGGNLMCASWDEAMRWVDWIITYGWRRALTDHYHKLKMEA